MFKDIIIKNFRCFSSLHLKDLARVNLIAGKNNTGKTALLEAIHLHCDPSDSALPTKINQLRRLDDAAKAFEEIWGWLFFDKNPANAIELTSIESTSATRVVTYDLLDANTARMKYPIHEQMIASKGWPASQKRLVVRYQGPHENSRTIGIFGGNGEAWYEPVPAWNIECSFLPSGLPQPEEDVERFGLLDREKRLGEVIPSLRILEPRLERLSLSVLGGGTIIHGDLKGLSNLVPLPLMGEGLRRISSILFALAVSKGGLLLIDEIENGFHYSVQKQVWQAIAKAARQNNVQVFATTHSWECLVKAHEAFAEDEVYDFRLHRLQEVRGEMQAVSHDQEMIEVAIYGGVEVR